MSGELPQSVETLSDALRLGRKRLASSRTETPGLDAEVLLRHLLNIDRTQLFVRLSEPIDHATLTTYTQLIEDRARDVPVAYLTGVREFMSLPFAVGPGVLVPRPETEILVEWAIAWLHHRSSDPVMVVDVGTGSGVIAISIADAMGPAWLGRVVASDISSHAATIASQNRNRFQVEDHVNIVQGSLLSWLRSPVDLVLANLPYLCSEQISENPSLTAEPAQALDGGVDGLDLIRHLLADAPRVVGAGGALGLEIDPAQRDDVVRLARRTFPDSEVGVLTDLAGLDRHVTVQTAAKR